MELLLNLTGLRQLKDLVLGHVQQPQARQRRFHQFFGALTNVRKGAFTQRFAIAQGQQVLLLSKHELGRVDIQQDVVLGDLLTGSLDIQLFDPALDPRVKPGDPLFVVIDAAQGVDRAGQRSPFRRRCAHARCSGRLPDRFAPFPPDLRMHHRNRRRQECSPSPCRPLPEPTR